MPEGAVYVGRPTRWGNPFWHTQKFHGLDLALQLYRNSSQGIWDPSLVDGVANPSIPYRDHQEFLRRMGGHPLEAMRCELTGKDLACWCPLEQSCHADVLLELANH
jgi:hypothetical protein